MNEVLHQYGWIMYYECLLCGRKKKHYKHKEKIGWEVVINTKLNQASIFHNNMLIKGPVKAENLESKLKEL